MQDVQHMVQPHEKRRGNQSLGSPHAAAAEIHQPDRRRTVRTRRPGRDRRRVLQAYGSHRHLHLGLVRGEGHRAGKKIPADRHPHLHRGPELQERRIARPCRRLRQGPAHAACLKANGLEGHRVRLYRIEQQLQGHAFALPVEQIAGDGVRNGSVPQLILLPQGRQRHYQQRRSVQEL